MPVLINKSNQTPEDLSPVDAQKALDSGSHGIPLLGPDGQGGVAGSISEAQNLMSNGYSQPDSGQLGKMMFHAKYNTIPQKIASTVEGAMTPGSMGFLPGAVNKLNEILPNPLEKYAPVQTSGEDTLARQQEHPALNVLGQFAGLGMGAANQLNLMGDLASQAALGKVVGSPTVARLGSSFVRNYVQGSMLSLGNDVTKILAGDPSTTAESAIAHAGLTGAMTGAAGAMLGTVPMLWEGTKNSQALGKVMSALKNKVAGAYDPSAPFEKNLDGLFNAAGVQVDDPVKAQLAENSGVKAAFGQFMEDHNPEGLKKGLQGALSQTLGVQPDQLPEILGQSDAKTGEAVKSSLLGELRAKSTPLSQTFDTIRSTLKGAPFPQEAQATLSENIQDMAKPFANLGDESREWQLLQGALSKIPKQETLEDFRTFASNYEQKAYSQGLWSIYKPMQRMFRGIEDDYTQKAVGALNPELAPALAQARTEYANLMDHVDSLNERLHVGHYSGPGTFINAVQDMKPEQFLSRMTPANDAGHIMLMQGSFPETAPLVKQAYMTDLLQSVGKSGEIKANRLSDVLQNKWSPELRNWVLPGDVQSNIGAFNALQQASQQGFNAFKSDQVLDYIRNNISGGIQNVTSHIMKPFAAYAGAHLAGPVGAAAGWKAGGVAGDYLGGKLAAMMETKLSPAAIMSTLHFLSGDGTINTAGSKALADYFGHAINAQAMLNDGIASVFEGGSVKSLAPNPKAEDKLSDLIDEYNEDPSKILQLGGQIGAYAPGHQAALSQVVGRAHNYLSQVKPSTDPMGLLDEPLEPSQTESASYKDTLALTNNPLLILNKIRDGDITPSHVAVLEGVYPSLHAQIKNKLVQRIMYEKQEGNIIPYQTRLALSTYLGQNLDSTIGPQTMLGIMPKPQEGPGQTQPGQKPPGKGGKGGKMDKIKQIPGNDMTMTQRAEQDRITPQ